MEKNKYFYKDGTEAKIGDITFYSEFDGITPESHYGDSIMVIEKYGFNLIANCRVMTKDNGKSFVEFKESKRSSSGLRYCVENWAPNKNEGGVLKHFTKIGTLGEDDHMISSDYSNEHYKIN